MNLDDIDCDGMIVDQNCDQVRRKIRQYLDSGEKKGEFCRAIGVSDKSLNGFLGQSGAMKGSGSDAFTGAWEFFKKREIAGVKMPSKKQKADASSGTGAANEETAAKKNVKKAGNTAGLDLSSVELPGEQNDSVPVQDTCDEVRRKINAHLKLPGVTQAQFCRDMQSVVRSGNPSTTTLSSFRGKKGPSAGNTSNVYYAAYVFFEKMRIQQGKAKSKHRLEM